MGSTAAPTPPNPNQADIGDVCAPTPRPVPTSNEQCMKAGWKTDGIFKNHGVSFVSSRGKRAACWREIDRRSHINPRHMIGR